MLCMNCKDWCDVGHPTRKRCLVAAPLKNKRDKAMYALTAGLDGCASGGSVDEVVEEVPDADND